MPTRYLFIDEAGNLDFTMSGSKLFVFICLTGDWRASGLLRLHGLRQDMLRRGLDIEYFHASENKQDVRTEVFRALHESHVAGKIVALVVEKAAVPLAEREPGVFYTKFLRHTISHVIEHAEGEHVIITDSIPIQKKRRAIEKALRSALAETHARTMIYHHASKSHLELQCADYFGWAIWRYLTKSELLIGRIPVAIQSTILRWP
ncbi:MAG: DUF3800 domain-containing protein [Opitutales bacterium]|jgi:hypothetical protein|nr:DUF3800 domain-containing protein [Opitutales bacterium]MDP4775601.1 DUF3800 domain-containing protein [Opitutales bacterium]MDP4788069.1 DUF3800 domain-containing protein [Opitutales bacterium]MDP4894719.1 DUF3800 domain-containing protein [Opitutales bacterium]